MGVVTGIQEKFSFKGVAIAAIGGAISGTGLGQAVSGAAGITGKVGEAAVFGAVNGAASQGIGVATGLQDSFSWVGVAAAGVGAAAGQAFGAKFGGAVNSRFGDFGEHIAKGSARALANAATRSALEGSNFGDNVLASIPDVIGQTLGDVISARAGAGSRSLGQPNRVSLWWTAWRSSGLRRRSVQLRGDHRQRALPRT